MARTLTPTNAKWVQNASRPYLVNSDPILITNGQAWNAGMFLKLVSGAFVISSTSAANGVGADKISHFALNTQTDPGNATTKVVAGVVHADDLWEMNLSTAAAATRAGTCGIKFQLVTTGTTLNEVVAGDTHKVFQGVNPAWAERPIDNIESDLRARITVNVLQTAIDAVGA